MKQLQAAPMVPVPEIKIDEKELPDFKMEVKPVPSTRQRKPKKPDVTQVIPEKPKFGNQDNMVLIGDDWFEIKPTKLFYMRNGTATFYHMIDTYPTPDIPVLNKGTVDPNRNGDKCLTDWLVAVTDNPDFVAEHINDFDGETIWQMLQIFKRLNHITEKEEALKKAQTQGKEV